MRKINYNNQLDTLPINFRHEKIFLYQNKLDSWEKLKNLSDSNIFDILKKAPLCTERSLKKIRAVAIFINDLKIAPHHAYLLLHCGIGSLKTLAISNPEDLVKKIGRLERKLNIRNQAQIKKVFLKEWICEAKNLI